MKTSSDIDIKNRHIHKALCFCVYGDDFFVLTLYAAYAPALGLFSYLNEAPVNAVLADKLAVSSLFGNSAVIDYKYLIGVLDSCETMCDGDDRLALCKLGYCRLDKMLVFGVDGSGGFVKDYDRSIFEDSSCDGYSLLFAA